jgi:hypothetical protein
MAITNRGMISLSFGGRFTAGGRRILLHRMSLGFVLRRIPFQRDKHTFIIGRWRLVVNDGVYDGVERVVRVEGVEGCRATGDSTPDAYYNVLR